LCKVKIGAIDCYDKAKLFIRSNFDENQIEIEVDANGAFGLNEADKITLNDFSYID
jgi:hypothetical protein